MVVLQLIVLVFPLLSRMESNVQYNCKTVNSSRWRSNHTGNYFRLLRKTFYAIQPSVNGLAFFENFLAIHITFFTVQTIFKFSLSSQNLKNK